LFDYHISHSERSRKSQTKGLNTLLPSLGQQMNGKRLTMFCLVFIFCTQVQVFWARARTEICTAMNISFNLEKKTRVWLCVFCRSHWLTLQPQPFTFLIVCVCVCVSVCVCKSLSPLVSMQHFYFLPPYSGPCENKKRTKAA